MKEVNVKQMAFVNSLWTIKFSTFFSFKNC